MRPSGKSLTGPVLLFAALVLVLTGCDVTEETSASPDDIYPMYVDDNEDGICDRAQDGSPTWHGPNFVDEDNDGRCDYWEPGGRGHGGRHHGGRGGM